MKSYQEIIRGDIFKKKDSYFVDTAVNKMCWGCESMHTAGFMVFNASKNRRIFFCQNCYDKLE